MGKKCKPCICKAGLPMWLGTFGDLMSLLLTFFVLLLSMATFDAKKLLEAEGSFKGAMTVLPGGVKFDPSRERIQLQTPMVPDEEKAPKINKIDQEIMDYSDMNSLAQGPANVLEKGDEGFMLRLPTSAMFEQNSDKIDNQDVRLFARRIADIVKKLPKNIVVNIIGHTDNAPLPKDSQFTSKLELSAYRALALGRLLIEDGIAPSKIQVSGEGATQPISTNDTEEGRKKNNRIEVRFEATNPGDIKTEKSVLGS